MLGGAALAHSTNEIKKSRHESRRDRLSRIELRPRRCRGARTGVGASDHVWHRDAAFEDVDLIVLPGGSAYGDYLRVGAMAAHSPVMREVQHRAQRGVPTLGICNRFQVLTETGLLPGALMRNASLKFVCADANCRVETGQSLFTSAFSSGEVLRWPVAHHDGSYFADADTLDRLELEGADRFPLFRTGR